jgi:hypothetical protein
MGLGERASRFFRSLTARPDEETLALAEGDLPRGLAELLREQPRPDLAHSLRVYKALRAQGESHPDLLAAALLHDVGKARYPLYIWERVLIVLAQRFLPALAVRWGTSRPESWRRPFVVAHRHPEWGAEQVARRGGSALLVDIIRRHQADIPPEEMGKAERLIRRLQVADRMN